jgi:two-component system chemotaxis response regulator CheB
MKAESANAGVMRYEAVAVGVSAGGVHALNLVLPGLPAGFPLPVIVVQHVYPLAENRIVGLFDDRCELRVKEAEEKEPVLPGHVYYAPPNYHLLVEEDRTFSLSTEERVNYARPSIDVLFETASDAYGSRLVGVVLTGANRDGSEGLQRIKEAGGLTVVQDPDEAEVDVMPRAALKAVDVDHVLSLTEMGPFLVRLAGLDAGPGCDNAEDTS